MKPFFANTNTNHLKLLLQFESWLIEILHIKSYINAKEVTEGIFEILSRNWDMEVFLSYM